MPGGCARGEPNLSAWSCVLSLGGSQGLEQGQSILGGGVSLGEGLGQEGAKVLGGEGQLPVRSEDTSRYNESCTLPGDQAGLHGRGVS